MGSADPLCFLTEREKRPASDPSTAEQATFDPLAAFCEGDLLLELFFEAAKAAGKEPAVLSTLLGALRAMPAVALILTPFLPALVPLLVFGGSLVATTPILIKILKAAGPGAVGDLLGVLLDKFPELTGKFISMMTLRSQAPTQEPVVDIAHQIMGRRNKGECAVRGLALEIAFETADESHLDSSMPRWPCSGTKPRWDDSWAAGSRCASSGVRAPSCHRNAP